MTKLKRKSSPIYVAWISMYFSTLMIFEKAGALTSVNMGSSYRVATVSIAGIIAATLLTQRGAAILSLFYGSIGGLFAYSIVSLFSSIYASEPLYTIWKSLELCIIAVLISIVVRSKDSNHIAGRLYQLTLWLIGLTLASVIVNFLISPEKALKPVHGIIPYAIEGYLPVLNMNSVGALSAIATLAALIRVLRADSFRGRLLFICLSVVCFLCLIFSTSRTGLIMFVGGLLVFSVFDRRYKQAILLVGLIVVGIFAEGAREYIFEYVRKGQNLEAFTKLSGRIGGWTIAWEYFKESPMLGHGMFSATRVDILGGGGGSTLHGALFDVIIGVGMVGLAPWLIFLIWSGYRIFQPKDAVVRTKLYLSARAELLAIYSMLLLRTVASSSLAYSERETLLFASIVVFSALGARSFQAILTYKTNYSEVLDSSKVPSLGRSLGGLEPTRILRKKTRG